MLLSTAVKDLFLRELCMDDLEGFYSWQNDPEIAANFAFTRLPRTLEEARKILAAIVEGHVRDSVHLAVVLRSGEAPSEEFLGVASLKNISPLDRHAEFAIVMGARRHMRKGYGKAAALRIIRYGFHTLNLRKVYLSVLGCNETAIHLYEGLGFRREGLFREHLFREGIYEDLVWYSLLKEELRE